MKDDQLKSEMQLLLQNVRLKAEYLFKANRTKTSSEFEALLSNLGRLEKSIQKFSADSQKVNVNINEQLVKYKQLYFEAPVAYFTVNKTGNIYELNEAAAELIGLPVAVCNRTSVFPYLEEQAKSEFIRFMSKVFATDKILRTEIIFKKSNSEYINTGVQAQVYFDDIHNEKLCLLAISDLSQINVYSQLEESKKKAKEHERHYKTIFYESQTINLLIDSETGNIVDCNQRAADFYGYSSDELVSMNISELNVLSPFEIAVQMQKAKEQEQAHFHFKHRLKDGQIRHVEVYSKPMRIGSATFLHSVIFDVEDKYLAQEQVTKLSTAVIQSPASIVITDLDANIEFVNPKFSEITGYSPEEAYGKNPKILSTKHTPRETYEKLWKQLEQGKSWEGEFVNRRKDGTVFWERARIAPIHNSENEIISYVAVKEDITERKKAEQKANEYNLELNAANQDLRENNLKLENAKKIINKEREQLLSIFDSIPELIYVADPETMEVFYTNKKMQEVIGRDITGEKCYEAIQGKKEACDFCTNKIILKQDKAHYWEYHNANLKKDYYIIDRAINWPDGRTARFEMAVDITGKKAQQKQLEKRLKYEETLADSSAVLLSGENDAIEKALIYILKGTGVSRVYIFQNHTAKDGTLLTSQTHQVSENREISQKNISDLQNIPYIEAGYQRWLELLSQGEVLNAALHDLPEQEQVLLEAKGVKSILLIPLMIDNRWEGFIGFDDTVNERLWLQEDIQLLKTAAKVIGLYLANLKNRKEVVRQMKTLEELNATKDKFFSIIAHDLKSPFNAIIGFSSILNEYIDKKNPEQLKSLVDTIKYSADKTYKLLENLLEWARSQTGRLSFSPEEINLHNFLIEIIGVHEAQASKKDIEIFNQTPKNAVVTADRNMLNTVLRNLLNNAIKYTEKGGTVAVDFEEFSDEIRISVTDTGIGISPENLERLFDISEKFSEKGTEGESGTGLGLILCKEFIEKHKGRIWAEAGQGSGTIFSFTLPNK
jgi:PAS domain S-box-containing protein